MLPDHLRKELGTSFGRVRDGFILAFIGMLVSIPQVRYESVSLYQKMFNQAPTTEQLNAFFVGYLFMVLSTLVIMVLVGDLANRRAGTNPFRWPGHKQIWPVIGLGLLFIPVIYFMYDHIILVLIPELYPPKLGYALLFPFSVSFPDELLVRFGFLGLALWVLRKIKGGKVIANIFIAMLAALYDWYNLTHFIGTPLQGTEIALILCGAFLENLIAGAFYIKHGFWSALAFSFGTGWKYLLYFWLFL